MPPPRFEPLHPALSVLSHERPRPLGSLAFLHGQLIAPRNQATGFTRGRLPSGSAEVGSDPEELMEDQRRDGTQRPVEEAFERHREL